MVKRPCALRAERGNLHYTATRKTHFTTAKRSECVALARAKAFRRLAWGRRVLGAAFWQDFWKQIEFVKACQRVTGNPETRHPDFVTVMNRFQFVPTWIEVVSGISELESKVSIVV